MNELKDLRVLSGIPAPVIADAVKTVFPKFDRYLLSKCEQSDLYGVTLLPRGMKAVRALAPEIRPKKKDGHRNQFRIYCRMDAETYTELFRRIQEDGYKTMQDWIMAQITAYINKPKGENNG